MELTLMIIAIAMAGAGLALSFNLRKHRSERALSLPWYRRGWHVPWTATDYYTNTGMKLYNASYFLIMGVLILLTVVRDFLA